MQTAIDKSPPLVDRSLFPVSDFGCMRVVLLVHSGSIQICIMQITKVLVRGLLCKVLFFLELCT
jgi:hypothetical protein